ncbi:hypothetical protein [Nioella aestuarii]|uniref:hypothetical protein n=1 Tax=Nioella aestuarii TaxID=1662864 RepID=UPI003D7F9B35
MAKILVERTTRGRRFFHDSLASVQLWLDDEIEAACAGELKRGWKDRVLAGVLILASENEAFINAVGQLGVSGWRPESGMKDKLKLVRKRLTPEVEANVRPYSSVEELRDLRNSICHAKPEVDDTDRVELVEVEQKESWDIFESLNHSVEERLSYESYKRFRDDSPSSQASPKSPPPGARHAVGMRPA